MYSIEFLVRIYYDSGTMCSIEEDDKSMVRAVAQYYIHQQRVFNREEDKPVVRTMTLIFHTVFYQLVQSVPIDRAVAQCYLCT